MKRFFTIGIFVFFIITLVVVIMSVQGCMSEDISKIKTKQNVDAKKYMGRWYEIARLPNSFQKNCLQSSALYTLTDDGDVEIVNTCMDCESFKTRRAEISAYAPDSRDFSKLRVCFFYPFYSDYLILELDDNYQWALIGGANKNYLWILAREKTLPQNELDKIITLAQERGYDTSKLIFSKSESTIEKSASSK